jgi:hypothetical protein
MMLGAELNPIYGFQAPAATWVLNNMILPLRQLGFETDTLQFKLGDGVTAWNDLAYMEDGSSPSPGTGDLNFVYTQTVASASWNIVHNLGKYPSVSIVDSSGNLVVGDVNYISLNELIVTFSAAFSGQAYLN